MRSKASVWPHISDDVVINVILKGDVFEFYAVDSGSEVSCLVSCSNTGLILLQYTRPECHMSISWRRSYERESNRVIFLDKQDFSVGRLEYPRVLGRCFVRYGGRSRDMIIEELTRWIHLDIDFSDWYHMVRWICVCLRKDANRGSCWVLMECRVILGMLCMKDGRWGCVIVMCTWSCEYHPRVIRPK